MYTHAFKGICNTLVHHAFRHKWKIQYRDKMVVVLLNANVTHISVIRNAPTS